MKMKQLLANQENAKLSTGPKDTSKTRYNAVQYGLFSRSEQVVPGDGPNFVGLRIATARVIDSPHTSGVFSLPRRQRPQQ